MCCCICLIPVASALNKCPITPGPSRQLSNLSQRSTVHIYTVRSHDVPRQRREALRRRSRRGRGAKPPACTSPSCSGACSPPAPLPGHPPCSTASTRSIAPPQSSSHLPKFKTKNRIIVHTAQIQFKFQTWCRIFPWDQKNLTFGGVGEHELGGPRRGAVPCG